MRAGSSKKENPSNPDIYTLVIDLSNRVARLEQETKDMREDVKEVREEMSSLKETVLKFMESMTEKYNTFMKWLVVIIVIILSFVSAMFGLGWRPPT